MLLFLLYLIPILLAGVTILRRISSVNKFELLLPSGSILGLALFTFFLNSFAFIIKGNIGIISAYSVTMLLGLFFFKVIRNKNQKIDLPSRKILLLWFIGILIWGGLIYWKTANALIGSDVNLYYAIAHSFVKGNFPLLTPWQPDIPLAYHVGASELLGAFYYFTGLNFQFLHLFLSGFFIFCSVQIIVWFVKRHTSLISFLLSNLAAVVAFISFGFIYITWPFSSTQLPNVANINELVIWIRNLPTVNQAIEVYGAPINLDALIYFIFHSFGLAIFLMLIVLFINCNREKPLLGWAMICFSLAGLALVNESLFVAAFPAIILGILIIEHKTKTLLKNIRVLLLLVVLTVLIVFLQGGIISASIGKPEGIEKSAMIFPKKEDIKEDFKAYHLGQESSKLLPIINEGLPLRWFHIGIDVLLLLGLIAVLKFNNLILFKVLFIAGFSSLVAYNIIVPKFLVANGNRFLAASFLFFSLLLCLFIIELYEKILKKRILKFSVLIIVIWIFIPTILPPLVLLSKNRFGENKLIPKYQQSSEGILWLKENITFNKKVLVLDKNTPHPSGQVRALVEAGVFAPVFAGNFRAFTIEASPEYLDAVYYLSPHALKKLNIDLLLIDKTFFVTLPEIRKMQLQENKFFEKIFDNSKNENGEVVYKINSAYLTDDQEVDGTMEKMASVLPPFGKIYIDNEENFNPSFLRRALIFSIRDKDIYYLPQSGVYLNVEANINFHSPREDHNYDYLILGKNTNSANLCKCSAELIWTGFKDQVFLWKVNH